MLAAKSTQPFLSPTLDNGRQSWLYARTVKARRWVIGPLSLLGFWLAGCATQADLQRVQSERGATRTQVANINASIDSLRREVQRGQGELEELRHRLTRVSKQESGAVSHLRKIEERLATLEGRLRSVERSPGYGLGEPALPSSRTQPSTPALPFGVPSGVPPAPLGAPPGTLPPLPAASGTSTADSPECQDLYRGAVRLFQDQQYNPAIQEFRTFQRRCPDSQMADDAQYWIGESHYVQNDYHRAILEFNDVLSYRRGDRIAAALLRQAQAFLAIGDKTDARLILQKLVSDYPSAAQTTEAQTMLQTLGR